MNRIFAAAAVFLIVLLGVYWLPTPNSMTTCMKVRHYNAIKEETLSRLVAPASAKFPPLSKVDWSEQDPSSDYCVYDVRAYVDAQNSFGAMIRSQISARTIGYSDGPSIIGLTISKP